MEKVMNTAKIEIQKTMLAEALANLINGYSFEAKNKFELIESIDSIHEDREYYAFNAQSQFEGEDLELSFSLYCGKAAPKQDRTYEPIAIELVLGCCNVDDEDLLLEHWDERLKQISKDLFNNTFTAVEF